MAGTVTLDGKPAAGASVWLLPEDEHQAEPSTSPAVLIGGLANERGEFELMTNGVHRGAPPGSYLVGVTWPDPKFVPDREGGERGKDLMPPEVRNPRTSGLKFEVKPDGSGPPLTLEIQPRRGNRPGVSTTHSVP